MTIVHEEARDHDPSRRDFASIDRQSPDYSNVRIVMCRDPLGSSGASWRDAGNTALRVREEQNDGP